MKKEERMGTQNKTFRRWGGVVSCKRCPCHGGSEKLYTENTKNSEKQVIIDPANRTQHFIYFLPYVCTKSKLYFILYVYFFHVIH